MLEFRGYIFWVSYGPYPDFLYLFSTAFSGVVAGAHLAIRNNGRFCLILSTNYLLATKSNYVSYLYNTLHFEINIVIDNPQSQVRVFFFITWYKTGPAWTHALIQPIISSFKFQKKSPPTILQKMKKLKVRCWKWHEKNWYLYRLPIMGCKT